MNLVREYTSEVLRTNPSALNDAMLDIALDLKLTGPTYPEFPNQLFNDLHFIKVKGRPTLFIQGCYCQRIFQ